MISFTNYVLLNQINEQVEFICEQDIEFDEEHPLWKYSDQELGDFEKSRWKTDQIFRTIQMYIKHALMRLSKEYGVNNPKVMDFMKKVQDELDNFINNDLKNKVNITNNGKRVNYNHLPMKNALARHNMPPLPKRSPPPLPKKQLPPPLPQR